MTYSIEYVGTSIDGWRYRVTLWIGRTAYRSVKTYADYRGAERAAKASGATERKAER